MSIEEIRKLVRQEKETEEKLREAEKEAANLIERARERALKILQEAENPETYDKIFEEKLTEVAEKKKLMEKEVNEKTKRLRGVASKNMEKTVSFIVRYVLGE
jgi:vacuolar-type H+-ATPase subunit H